MLPTSLPSIPPEDAQHRCLYRGNPYRQAPLAHGPDRGQPVDVFSCGYHGECTQSRVTDGVVCCAVCQQFQTADSDSLNEVSPQNSVDAMVEALRQPPREWPRDWPYWGTTLEAHRRLATEYEASIPPYPVGKYQGRGIVILGGGSFYPGVYVTVRMIRHFGCQLPIEVWHHGANEPVVARWLEPFGVRFVDTDRHMDANPERPRLRGGWASKLYVMLHSSFEEVLHLDSDCYPVSDVTALFDHNAVGSILWPSADFCDGSIHWHIYTTTHSGLPPINGGPLLIDKVRCWKTLVLAQWWNDHADYAYKHGWGDQDVVRGVWQQQQQPWHRFADAPARCDRVLVDLGPGGLPVFVHRFNDKFRLSCMPLRSSSDDRPILYRSEQLLGEAEYDATLPQEEVAFQAFHQFLWLLDNDPQRYRPVTIDEFIWQETVHDNAYRLPAMLPPDCRIIDVGAHIGSFAHAALRRGAWRVWAFEVDPNNFVRCLNNLAFWGRRAIAREQAVWDCSGQAGYHPSVEHNVGGRVSAEGNSVATVAIDEVLDEVSEGGIHPIFLLKLDCEGSEWPILFTSRHLRRCEQIIGEYHTGQWKGKECWPEDLRRLFESQGFDIQMHPTSERQGLFWATRIGSAPS